MLSLQTARAVSTAQHTAQWPALVSAALALLACMPPAQARTETANACRPTINLRHYGPFDHRIGLAYVELGDFDWATVHAHEIRRLGFERSSLETLLRQNGK